MADPNSDDAEPMGRGLVVVLMVAGALLAGHFGLKLQDGLEQGGTGALGVVYIALFVLIGFGMVVLGLKRFQQAADEALERPQDDAEAR